MAWICGYHEDTTCIYEYPGRLSVARCFADAFDGHSDRFAGSEKKVCRSGVVYHRDDQCQCMVCTIVPGVLLDFPVHAGNINPCDRTGGKTKDRMVSFFVFYDRDRDSIPGFPLNRDNHIDGTASAGLQV